MNKLDMQSIDIVDENIERISELFPNVIVESANGKTIDFDLLKQELNKEIVEGAKEKYQLTWPGKKEAIVNANTPSKNTLRPIREKSVDFDNTENIYIEGDNLEALKILQESYLNKIKCIYIDPPYNTGKDFVYRDNYRKNNEDELIDTGLLDEMGNKLITNASGDGRYHSNWLDMIYPRLKLARNLLTADGVIFISIDDNEYSNLKKVCDEIFGEVNYIDTFYIQVRYTNKSLNEKDDFQKVMEQVLMYSKNKQKFTPNKPTNDYDTSKFCFYINELERGEKVVLGGKNVEIFKPGQYEIKEGEPSLNGLKATWASGSVLKGNTSGKFFDLQLSPRKDIDGLNVLYKVEGIGEDGLGYRYFTGPKKETATKGQFYSGIPLERLEQIKSGTAVKENPIVNYYDLSGDFGNIRNEGDVDFRAGKKPVKMLKMFFNMIKDDDFICLDFFSGSASTAHAINQLNSEDGGNRKFILVQIPEKIDENQDYYRAGFKTICDLGEERIRRANKKIKEKSDTEIDTGFRVYSIDSSNMKDVFYKPNDLEQSQLRLFESNIKEERTTDDLLTQVILDLGLTLDLKIEEKMIGNNKVYYVAGNSLVACFDDNIDINIVDKICECEPYKVVFKDSAFKYDNDKINLEEKFKKLLPQRASDEGFINIL